MKISEKPRAGYSGRRIRSGAYRARGEIQRKRRAEDVSVKDKEREEECQGCTQRRALIASHRGVLTIEGPRRIGN